MQAVILITFHYKNMIGFKVDKISFFSLFVIYVLCRKYVV